MKSVNAFFIVEWNIWCYLHCNRIGGVMLSVFSSDAIYRGFEPRSGQTKDYKIGICCFSAKHAILRRKSRGSTYTLADPNPNPNYYIRKVTK